MTNAIETPNTSENQNCYMLVDEDGYRWYFDTVEAYENVLAQHPGFFVELVEFFPHKISNLRENNRI